MLRLLLIVGIAIGLATILGASLYVVSHVMASLYGAPYVPSSRRHLKDMIAELGLDHNSVFYDLGSGDGRVLFMALRAGAGRAVGFERTLWGFLKSKCIAHMRGLSAELHFGDMLKASICEATHLHLYLYPELVDRVAIKIARECHVGTKIVSIDFPIDRTSHPEFALIKQSKIATITAYYYELAGVAKWQTQ